MTNIAGYCFIFCLLINFCDIGISAPAAQNQGNVDVSCTFESGFCSWYNDITADFKWRRSNNGTRDATSGPLNDHTTGKGYFAYIQGGDAPNSSWVASLVTPYVVVPLPTRLTFSYYMNGANIGSLKLIAESKDGTPRTVVEKSGRHGHYWHSITAVLRTGTYRLKFQANAKFHWSSDIAIDDVSVATIFKISPVTATTVEPSTTHTMKTMPTTSVLPTTCTFEQDTCGWHQDRNDELDWLRIKGKSSDAISGPPTDHTLQNLDGYYVYLNAKNSQNELWKGNLISDVLHLTSQGEISFWYYMNGPAIGTLSLLRLSLSGASRVIWSKQGRQGPSWQHAVVRLLPGSFKLELSATAKHHIGGDIAVDDVTLRTEVPISNSPPVVG